MVKVSPGIQWAWLMLNSQRSRPDFRCGQENVMDVDGRPIQNLLVGQGQFDGVRVHALTSLFPIFVIASSPAVFQCYTQKNRGA